MAQPGAWRSGMLGLLTTVSSRKPAHPVEHHKERQTNRRHHNQRKATDRIRLASLTIHARSWSSVMPANSTRRSPPSNTVVVLSPYFLRRQLAQCPPAGIHTQPRSRRYLVVYPQLSVDHHPVPRAVVGNLQHVLKHGLGLG